MRALRYHEAGKPADVLRLDELPVPAPGPGEALVRLTHRSFNPADLHAMLGAYGKQPPLPAVAGHEGAGRVEALGAGCERLAVGQRVVPMGVDGTWQEYVAVPEAACFAVPEGVTDEAAAQLFVNPLTAQLLLDTLALPEGAWLLQTAGTSQVGRLVVQLARARGLRTISLVRRESARAELEPLGADVVLVADAETDARTVRQAVLAHTSGRGADGAVDGVAGRLGGIVARCLASGATMLVYGGLSGQPLTVDAGALIFGQVAVRGFWRTGWFDAHPLEATVRHLETLAAAIVAGDLRLPVEASYDLAEVRDAIAHSRRPGTSGKVLLTG